MDQDDEGADALVRPQIGDEVVDDADLGPELQAGDACRRHDQRGALEREADERDLRVPDLADLVRRQDRVLRAFVEDVRGEVLEERAAERRAVLAAVDGMTAVAAELIPELHAQELVDPFVELVVAHARDIHPDRVHGLDRRLIVKEPGDQRARADQVATADGDGVRVRRAQGLDPRGEVLRPARVDGLRRTARSQRRPDLDPPARPRRRLQVAVEVVDRKKLNKCVLVLAARGAERCRYQGKDEEHSRAERGKAAFHVYLSPQSDTARS